jgi:hypothetical protein
MSAIGTAVAVRKARLDGAPDSGPDVRVIVRRSFTSRT